jgi:hypothetical protein
VILFIGSVLIPAGSLGLLSVNPSLLLLRPLAVIPGVFSRLGSLVSIGLLRSQEPARKAAIFPLTVPLLLLVLAMLVFLAAARSTHNVLFAGPVLIFGGLFAILLPINICSPVLLGRDRVRSQFR